MSKLLGIAVWMDSYVFNVRFRFFKIRKFGKWDIRNYSGRWWFCKAAKFINKVRWIVVGTCLQDGHGLLYHIISSMIHRKVAFDGSVESVVILIS